ncbi:MAG: alanine dehydrogenase [Acidobacteriota bacterium]|nr:MAG: alanine dehydrogenase [Acidobacteriota bacterium]
MNIGLPREVKDNEYRVGLVPAGILTLTHDGHKVLVERGAGEGSGFSDAEFEDAGAVLIDTADEVWRESEMIIKVKEPVAEEYDRMHDGQIIFGYFHLAPLPELTRVLLQKNVVAVAYETITNDDGHLPLLTPMSEIAGRMATIVGTYYLQKPRGGRGVLLGGVPGVRPALVVVIGGGVVGLNATKMAMGLGAQVSVLDVDVDKLRYFDDLYFGRVETLMSNKLHLAESLRNADLVIGGVLIPGANAPKLVSREMVSNMKPGSVIVDVAVDQGGCCETTRPTTHSDPVYEVDGVLHYCVTNMPGAMPRTSTRALTNVTLPYARTIARDGIDRAATADPHLCNGINVYRGHITCAPVAEDQGLTYTPIDSLL